MNDKLYRFFRPLIKIYTKIFIKPKIIGSENIPKTGRIILAGTHTNKLDCFLLISSTRRTIHFVAKDELWKFPKGIIFSHMGLIPVNRRIKDKTVIPNAVKYLENEEVIAIFPEGTIGKNGLLPFKHGAVKMAELSNSYIVPFIIKGKYYKDVKIIYGKPIKIGNDIDRENNKLHNLVLKMLREN